MAKSRQAEPDAPATSLYLVVPAACPRAELSSALEAADIACVLLRDGGLAADDLRAGVEVLCPLAQERGAAVLLEDRLDLAAETGCDGVHLNDPKGLATARKRLGEDAIVGIGCGTSRHDAMTAAERGADYVAFGAPGTDPGMAETELLGWWQDIMALPCVAFGAATAEDCARLADAGADFVAVGRNLDLAACRAALERAWERA